MANPQEKLRLFAGNLFPATGEYMIDPVHTFAEFGVQHIVVGQVRGRFDSVSGKIKIADDPLLSTIEFTTDTSTINTHHKDRDTGSPILGHSSGPLGEYASSLPGQNPSQSAGLWIYG